MILSRLFGPASPSEAARRLYGAVVAQARQPRFFTEYGFPDTVTGRLDVLTLHLFLVMRRCGQADLPALAQELYDQFAAEMDDALRSLGIGDQTVPKRKRRLVRSLYGVIAEFDAPLSRNDRAALDGAMAARFPSLTPEARARLALYVEAAADSLAAQGEAELSEGQLHWPAAGLRPQETRL